MPETQAAPSRRRSRGPWGDPAGGSVGSVIGGTPAARRLAAGWGGGGGLRSPGSPGGGLPVRHRTGPLPELRGQYTENAPGVNSDGLGKCRKNSEGL